MPRVSVIMGIYNSNIPDMVNGAIDSILKQTFSDFEFIICDDGSTDGTYELINNISSQDRRIKVIRNHRNQGLAYSLNRCLEISQGEYIARMDADDLSKSNRLQEQVNFLDAHLEFAVVTSWAELFENNEVWGLRKVPAEPQKKDLLFGPPFTHAAMMMRKQVLDKLSGYRVCKETFRAEDYDLWMRMYSLGYRGYNIQKPLYKIREDGQAYKRRAYKYRIDEMKIRYHGFKLLGLLPSGLPYVIKPLIVGLIPPRLLKILRGNKLN